MEIERRGWEGGVHFGSPWRRIGLESGADHHGAHSTQGCKLAGLVYSGLCTSIALGEGVSGPERGSTGWVPRWGLAHSGPNCAVRWHCVRTAGAETTPTPRLHRAARPATVPSLRRGWTLPLWLLGGANGGAHTRARERERESVCVCVCVCVVTSSRFHGGHFILLLGCWDSGWGIGYLDYLARSRGLCPVSLATAQTWAHQTTYTLHTSLSGLVHSDIPGHVVVLSVCNKRCCDQAVSPASWVCVPCNATFGFGAVLPPPRNSKE